MIGLRVVRLKKLFGSQRARSDGMAVAWDCVSVVVKRNSSLRICQL